MCTMTRGTSLIAVLMLASALMQSDAGAQDLSTPAPSPFGELDGARQAVSRVYLMDGIGTPGPDGEPGEIPERTTGMVSLGGVIGQFDSIENAAAAVDRVDEYTKANLEGRPLAPELENVDVDLGDTSRAYSTTQEVNGQVLNVSVIIVQQDEFLYVVLGGAVDADAQERSTTLAQTLIVNEAGDDEPRFNENGTSTGGLWDKFPKPDDALIANLVASDEQLYPEVHPTPSS